MMRLSDAGLDAIKRHEGLRLDAYPDPGSKDGLPVTIGHGSTRTLTGRPWRLGDRITEAEAEALLLRDVEEYEAAVNRLVTVPLTQAMFDALVSLCFNIGIGAFSASTLLRELNAGNYAAAQAQFSRWRMNDGKVMQGLVNRRAAEAAMFASQGLAPAAHAPIATSEVAAPAPKTIAAPESVFRPDDVPAAPIVASKPVYVAPEKPMTPFIAAALPALIQQIPGLIRQFGDGKVTERNAAAAAAVLEVVQAATGTTNAQAAVEAVKDDPQARAIATEALREQNWFDTTEAGSGGIDGAREFSQRIAEADVPLKRLPAFLITLALLPLPYTVVGAVMFMDVFSGEMKSMVVGGILGVLSTISAFWLGQQIKRVSQ